LLASVTVEDRCNGKTGGVRTKDVLENFKVGYDITDNLTIAFQLTGFVFQFKHTSKIIQFIWDLYVSDCA